MLTRKTIRTLSVRVALLALPIAFIAAACADEATPDPGTGAPTGTPTAVGGSGGGICLLNNCSDNEHCAGCSDNRNTCLIEESRCVACDPSQPIGQQGCPDGEECSPFGICVPLGLTCPTDAEGNPTVTCTQNSDCLACSPMHQVCDPATHRCQACTETNTQHCLQSDVCIDGKCSPKCPPSCQTDNDCMYCGGPGNEAHACNKHKCAQCSDTWPCPAGQQCDNGVCVPPCGKPGPISGTCEEDEDCHFCGGQENYGKYECKTPINNPDHGTCVPPAAGCSDLAPGLVLPKPWSDYTNTCSNDDGCNGIGILYDVGEQIRDLVGGSELSLGFTSVHICNVAESPNAAVQYDMPVCASIKIVGDAECGVCVPCEVDGDCHPIDIDPLIPGLFCQSAIATIAGAMLIDLLWGDEDDHHLNFFCQGIAAGYGICIPCGNPMSPCGSGGGTSTGDCSHQVTEVGGPLNPTCNACVATVCDEDPYCCDTEWDQTCVNEAASMCGGGCAHDPCTEGAALQASCSPCVQAICADDPFCCTDSWDSLCVDHVTETGHPTSCDGACAGGCAHSECAEGGPLTPTCSACATAVCNEDDYCCTYDWDDICVSIAEGDAACSC